MAEPICTPSNNAQVFPVRQPILDDPDACSPVIAAGRQTSFFTYWCHSHQPREASKYIWLCFSFMPRINLYYAKHIIFPPPFCIHSLFFWRKFSEGKFINHLIQWVIYFGFRMINFEGILSTRKQWKAMKRKQKKRNQGVIGLMMGKYPTITIFIYYK